MDWGGLGLIVFGAAIAYVFGELRAQSERRHQKSIRDEERAIRASEAEAERKRALWTKSVEATRRTLVSMLDHAIGVGAGDAERVAQVDAALLASGYLDHFSPALLGNPALLTRITNAALETDKRGMGNSRSWSQLQELTNLKIELNAAMLGQEERIARGEEPKRMQAGPEVDMAALAATTKGFEDWIREMAELFPRTESEEPHPRNP